MQSILLNCSAAQAVKLQRSSEQGTSPQSLSSRSEYPALPTEVRSPHTICSNRSTTNAVDSSSEAVIVTEEIGSFNMFNNPIYFLAFLAKFIQQTIVAKDQNENIDVFKIITGAARGRIGLPLDSEQLKIIFKTMAVTILQWNARSILKKLPEFKKYLSDLAFLPDVICIQATHLSPKHNPILPGYSVIRKDRPPHRGKGGGLGYA